MRIRVCATNLELGNAAAQRGAAAIREALQMRHRAHIILATGASQFETLRHLVAAPDIDWTRVTCFHLDEYVGMTDQHPASFRKYLRERFVELLPQPPAAFHYIQADGDPQQECARLAALIQNVSIDVAFIGIGENSHLAFNDPPANVETHEPYLVVDLDDACRQQQFGEGWFPTFDAVPRQAISMSIYQILRSRQIVCSVPDARKAHAVQMAVARVLTPDCPASFLRLHADCELFLDEPAASLLPYRQFLSSAMR